ncbi:unnamed protein product [Mytilus coruscus]|uniref:Uncharacterized protein n=1 Tax=Mytilus coruscus TaxID=42192 RepID=A0A6J8C9L2_MYTCO|nr:unnamed protein product [Mytilus coruscus]
MEESVVLLEKIQVQHSSPDGSPSLQAASDKTLSSAKATSLHSSIRNSTSSMELSNIAGIDSIADVCVVTSTATVTLGKSSQIATDKKNTKETAAKSETLPVTAHVLSSVSGNAGKLSVTSMSTGINVTIPTTATCHNEASITPPIRLSLAVLCSSSSSEYVSTDKFASRISSTKHSPIGTLTSIILSSISSTEHFSTGSLISAVPSGVSSTEHLTIMEENIMSSTQTEKSSSPQIEDSNLNKIELCSTKFRPETLSIADSTKAASTFKMATAERDVESVFEENENLAQSDVQHDNSQPSTPTSLDSIMSFSLSNNDSNDGSFYMEVDDIDNERNEDGENNDGEGEQGSQLSDEIKAKISEISDSDALPPIQSMEKDKMSTEALTRSKFSVDEPIERISSNSDKDADKDQSEETSISTDCNVRFPEITKQLACKFPSLPQANDSCESCDKKQSSETVKRHASTESKFDGRENNTAIKQKNYDTNQDPGSTLSTEEAKINLNKIEISSKSRNDNDRQSNLIDRIINDASIQKEDDYGDGSSVNEEPRENQKSKSEHTISFTNPTPVFLFANKNNKKFFQTKINKPITPKDFEDSPDLSPCTDSADKIDLQTSSGSKATKISKSNKVSKEIRSTTDVSTNKSNRSNTSEKRTAIKSDNTTSNSVIKIHHTTNPLDPNIVVVCPTSVVSSTQTTLVDSAGTQTPA